MQCANQNLKQLHVTGVERGHVQAAIGFGFSLAEKVGFYRPITERSNANRINRNILSTLNWKQLYQYKCAIASLHIQILNARRLNLTITV